MTYKGRIIAFNHQRGMFIVEIEDGNYAVFELLDSVELTIGDLIRGDLHGLGHEELLRVESQELFDAYGQSGPSSLSACRRLI